MQFSRRRFAYCSLGALSALAGCFGLIGEPQVMVTKIKGINLDNQPHTLAVTLSENDEAVYQSEHEVAAASEQMEGASFVIEEALPDSSGQYELEAMLDNSATERINLASEYGGSRLRIIIDIDQEQNLSFFVNRNSL